MVKIDCLICSDFEFLIGSGLSLSFLGLIFRMVRFFFGVMLMICVLWVDWLKRVIWVICFGRWDCDFWCVVVC